MNGNDADVDLGRAEACAAPSRRSGRRRARCPSAPASTCPLAAQIVGLPSSPISVNRRGKRSIPKCLCTSGTSAAKPPRFAPDGEDRLVRGGQHDAAHRRRRRARASKRRDQIVEQLVGERVAGVRLVERDRRDAVGDVVAEGVVGHGAHAYRVQRKVGSLYCLLCGAVAARPTRTRRRTAWPPPPTCSSPTSPASASTSSSPTSTSSCASRSAASSIKELAPHADEWEETTFPDWVFKRMGELGFLGLYMPEEYGGQGGDYYANLVLAEEMGGSLLRRPGDGRRGPHRHGDAADPRVRHRGAEAGVGRARDQGREDPLPRHHRARRRLRRRRHQDARGAATATSTSSTARRPTSPTATAPT